MSIPGERNQKLCLPSSTTRANIFKYVRLGVNPREGTKSHKGFIMLPQIFDDIIELEKQKKIESAVLSPDFNWFFANTATYKADENMSEKDKSLMNFKNTEDKFQFIHYLYRDKTVLSQKILIFDEILEKIFKIIGVEYNIDNLTSKLYRMKVNFTTPVNKKMSFVAPHIDVKGIDTYCLQWSL